MINKARAVCFSGHRTQNLPKTEDELDYLRIEIFNKIKKSIEIGLDTFIFGGCYGFDLLCAETVLMHKLITRKNEPEIKLIAVVPFKGQEKLWSKEDKEKYYNILKKCDDVIILSEKYSFDSYRKRNRFMIDNSSHMICYYNGGRSGTGYTVRYANKQGLDITNFYDFVSI